ncbi:MAG: hypothetical protein EB084_09045 [Proteobacteria bacterium]|nr:hypothetical protein [Pseudomonadota bacterium]
MPYEIRVEDDVFGVYEGDVYLGILACPYEQTEEDFERETREAGFTLIRRDEIANIDAFDSDELLAWQVFAIDTQEDEALDDDVDDDDDE